MRKTLSYNMTHVFDLHPIQIQLISLCLKFLPHIHPDFCSPPAEDIHIQMDVLSKIMSTCHISFSKKPAGTIASNKRAIKLTLGEEKSDVSVSNVMLYITFVITATLLDLFN